MPSPLRGLQPQAPDENSGKVSGLLYLLCEVTIWSTFKNLGLLHGLEPVRLHWQSALGGVLAGRWSQLLLELSIGCRGHLRSWQEGWSKAKVLSVLRLGDRTDAIRRAPLPRSSWRLA